MHLWSRSLQTLRPMKTLPLLLGVSSERQDHPSYHNAGRFRARDRHCIFKYTLEGEGRYSDWRGEHRIPSGHGFLCRINHPQTAYYYPAGGDRPWVFTYVSCEGGRLAEMVDEITQLHGSVFQVSRGEDVIRRMLEVRGWDQRKCVITAAWGAQFVFDLLTCLVASRERRSDEDAGRELVRRMRKAVIDRIQQDLTVTELADELQYSREYLTRTFKHETGITPHTYLVRQKMLAACNLLKVSDMSCKEIANWLGYKEPTHFTRTFKRSLGMTPTRFRRDGIMPPA